MALVSSRVVAHYLAPNSTLHRDPNREIDGPTLKLTRFPAPSLVPPKLSKLPPCQAPAYGNLARASAHKHSDPDMEAADPREDGAVVTVEGGRDPATLETVVPGTTRIQRPARNRLEDKPAGPTDQSSKEAVMGLSAAGNNRRDKVVMAIEAWNQSLEPALRHEKYMKMSLSPFSLYRGTVHLYWADFAGDWRMARFGNPRTRTWLLGDMHVYNMGAFYNSKGQLAYGLNDFDESVIGDYQYDLWRLAISIVLCCRENGDLTNDEQREVIFAFAQSYLSSLVSYKRTPEGRVFTADNTYGRLDDFLKTVEKEGSSGKMLAKWAHKGEYGQYTGFNYKLKEKLLACTEAEKKEIINQMPNYRVTCYGPPKETVKWEVLDIAVRISSGLGSLGVPRYYILLRETNGKDAHVRILDVKRQTIPAAVLFFDESEQREYNNMFEHEGLRHFKACAALTSLTDSYLGWMKLGSKYFSVRERSPYKFAFPALKSEARGVFKELVLSKESRWRGMAEQWGKILATEHAHARHDFDGAVGRFRFRQEVDELTRQFRDEFAALVWQVAQDYSIQVEADWRYFMERLAPDDASLL